MCEPTRCVSRSALAAGVGNQGEYAVEIPAASALPLTGEIFITAPLGSTRPRYILHDQRPRNRSNAS